MFPIILKIGSFTLHAYGLLVVAGFAAGLWLSARLAGLRGIDANRVFDLGTFIAVAGVLGAKLLMFIEDWRYYGQHPSEIFSMASLQAGGVFYGGFILAVATALWYMRRHALPFLSTADCMTPGLTLGHAIGRLGCFAAGCCWGHPTSVPWAVTFRNPYSHEMVGVPLDVPLHPAQLYEFAALLGLTGVLLAIWKRRAFAGETLSAYLMLYGVARFLLEYTRDRSGSTMPFGLVSLSQGIALLLIPAGVILWLKNRPT